MAGPADDKINIPAAVVDSSPDAIITVDLDGRIVGWNPAAERMTGFAANQSLGRQLMSLIPAVEREDAVRLLERVRRGEVISGHEVVRLRHDGSTLTGSLTLAPIRDGAGRICGSVGMMRDITEYKRVQEMARRNERLGSLGTLAAGMAHEINNPVGGILMAAQYARSILDRDGGKDLVYKALADIETDAKRCRDIVRGLADLGAGGDSERSECDLDVVVESALDLVRARLPMGKTELRFAPCRSLPRVPLDRAGMEQALVNLIDNAIEASSRVVRIATAAQEDPRGVCVTIADDGAGIPPDMVDHVFDPFFTTRRQAGSMGLGLSLAHAIVGAHGGRLDVASSPGSGTMVTLHLPLSVASAG